MKKLNKTTEKSGKTMDKWNETLGNLRSSEVYLGKC
jgi:hypothetical protein